MKDAKSLMSVMMLSMIACTGDKLEETQFRELFPTLTLTTESVDFETVVLYTDTQEFQIINSGLAELDIASIEVEGNDDGVYTVEPTEGVVEVLGGVECQFVIGGLSEAALCGSKVRVSERGEFAECVSFEPS